MTQKNNYKLFCAGIDDEGRIAKLYFYVYKVRGIENAKRIVKKDKLRRKFMRLNNIDWKTVELPGVQCDSHGRLLEGEEEKEKYLKKKHLSGIVNKQKKWEEFF
jgi:hypothetical protein